jgi:hypothetical protein
LFGKPGGKNKNGGDMREEAIKNYFRAIVHHTTDKGYIIGTLYWFESDDELEIMTEILNKSQKMSISEIELKILEEIVERRKKEEKWVMHFLML